MGAMDRADSEERSDGGTTGESRHDEPALPGLEEWAHQGGETADPTPPGLEGRVAKLTRVSKDLLEDTKRRSDRWRDRIPVLDTGWQIFERDRDAAGTLLGSALALRLFLFFVPFLLLLVGLAGIIGPLFSIEKPARHVGIAGALADDIDATFDQSSHSPWIAILIGLWALVWTGRSLSRALILSSALSWRLGGGQKVGIRVAGTIVGILSGFGLAWTLVNQIRQNAGVAVVTISFVTVALVYVALWSLLYVTLPRATSDPGAALPGAALIALTVTGLQAVSILYLPSRISDASSVYGIVGYVVVLLGWFFIIGRVLAFSFALNAVIYETYGSISQLIFGLPVIRLLPRRWPFFVRYFDLDTGPDAHSPDER
jgi:membrane protein